MKILSKSKLLQKGVGNFLKIPLILHCNFLAIKHIFHTLNSNLTARHLRCHTRLPASPPGKQWWRPQTPIGVAGISWTTNKSASARNTAVAFYPGVYQGVIYISAGKAVSEEIYRLVDELYLDWIFSCINRGKIYNMVGGSATHTQTTLQINK